MQRLLPLLLLPLFLALPAHAEEVGHGVEAAHATEHGEGHAHSWLFGVRGSSQMPLVNETEEGVESELALEPGVGLFAAWVANPGLEIELAGRMVFAEEHTLVPLELMFKHPFGHETLQPYVGAGPTLVLSTAEAADPVLGVSTVAGSYLWLAPRLGFLLEANYNLLFGEEMEPELGVALGFVTAF